MTMNSPDCPCVYDEYGIRTEVCRTCAAGLEQRTRDWYQARCGFATASKAFDIIAKTQKGTPTAKRVNYLFHVVGERLTGMPQGLRFVRSLDERTDLEPEARTAYELYFNKEVTTVGFIHHPTIPFVGASPDGYIGHDGLLEIKALDASTQAKLWLGGQTAKDVIEEYIPQVELGMACTDKSWCDFISWCPFMKDEELRLWRRIIHRDELRILRLQDAVQEFLAEVDEKVVQVKRGGLGFEDESLLAQLTGSIAMIEQPAEVVPIKTKRKRTAIE